MINPDDGFGNLNDDVMGSVLLDQTDLKLMNPKVLETKNKKKTLKLELEREVPESASLNSIIQGYLTSVGTSLISTAGSTIKKVPGTLGWGVAGIFNAIKTNMDYYYNKSQSEQVKQEERKKQEVDFSQEIILIVMPEYIINSDIPTQTKWIEEHQDEMATNIHLIKPIQLNYNLKTISDSNVDKKEPGPDDGVDLDTYPDDQGKRFNQESLFKGVQDIDDLSNSQCIIVSTAGFQTLQENIKQQQHHELDVVKEIVPEQNDVEQIKVQEQVQLIPMKKVTFYPYLPSLVVREQFNVERQLFEEAQRNQETKAEVQQPQLRSEIEFINKLETISNQKQGFVTLPVIQTQVQKVQKQEYQKQEVYDELLEY